MPKRSGGNRRGSHRGRGRGGQHRGGRGRGGGGHGRNRHLIPSSYGFVYEPGKHNTFSDDDYEDDFPVFAQFGAVDDPNDDGTFVGVNGRQGSLMVLYRFLQET